MLTVEKFNGPKSMEILLADNVFFEVRCNDKKTRPRICPIWQGRYF